MIIKSIKTMQHQEQGESRWLAFYPIQDQGYDLNKQQIWRDVCLRLLKVCKSVDIEPQLLLVTGENRNNERTNTANEATDDIKLKEFWVRGHSLI